MYIFSFWKRFGKTNKETTDALKYLNLSNEIDELTQIESIFLKIELNNLIIDKLKEIKHSQNNTKIECLEHTAKRAKNFGFSKYSLPIVFKEVSASKMCH